MTKYICLDESIEKYTKSISDEDALKVLKKLQKYGQRSTQITKKYEIPVGKAIGKYFEHLKGKSGKFYPGNPIKKSSDYKRGDGGIDGIESIGGKNILIQLKCMNSKNDPEYVERLIATLGKIQYNSNEGVYVNLKQEQLASSITETLKDYEYNKIIYSISNIMVAKLIIKYKINF